MSLTASNDIVSCLAKFPIFIIATDLSTVQYGKTCQRVLQCQSCLDIFLGDRKKKNET